MKNSIKLFEFSGIPVYLKYWFFILFLLISFKTIVIAFISILIHELAHAWTAKKLGYRVEKVYIDIFHGAAEIDLGYEKNYKDTLRIVSAGPLSNAVLVLLGSSLLFSGLLTEPLTGFITLFVIINLFLSLFNMLPIYPLDGGRITKAVLVNHFGQKGKKFNGYISIIFSSLLLIYSVLIFDWILIFFSLIFIIFSYYELNGENELNRK